MYDSRGLIEKLKIIILLSYFIAPTPLGFTYQHPYKRYNEHIV